ncbi:B12-binding domain-containing radical SAM protein [Desulfosporosinus meridiei]|uniref:Fe-S oxidoreductase n=1 Tax=Desulfosporosinus meridiei (strain ATCC BAA-275 / DSM 13257 / KCTC 12902 / NCIMB 13706 / S10) TaxID=768704 RepID=J7IR50_DESMD|nr:radical SAM protein [Desulfosporosinus meridiei]AFQ44125.1 Fe-S oxidoreductase [Desulfosporosinus meridiei DSM 13257]
MKIKLIQPKMSLRPMDSEFKRLMSPSLSLLVLAALTPKEHSIIIEDENANLLNLEDSPDLVGITVNIDTSNRGYQIAEYYRKKKVPVILGGIHVSANPEEALQFADSICIGEAENLWLDILSDVSLGQLKPKYYSTIIADPSKIPIPRWSLTPSGKYLYTNIIVASRGCPFKCEFCYNSCDYVHHQYRNRPIANVLEEIKQLKTKHVMFIDDNLIGDIGWTRAFLEEIKPLGLKWNAAVSANILNHLDVLDQMQESGCQSLFIGFESINEQSIRSVQKFQNKRENYERLIHELHKRGIMVNASLVFGFDHDSPQVFQNTLDWLVKNKVETMTAHILTPYPGTILYERFFSEGRIVDFDLSHYNTANVVFSPKQMSQKELLEGYLWIYKEFYSFKNIFKRIPDHPKQKVPYLLFSLIYRKFGKLISKIASLGFMSSVGRLARKLSYHIE